MNNETKTSVSMKTLAVIAVALIMVSTMSFAYAEDLSAKSDEELLALYQEIQTILLARNGNYTIELASGKYVIGTDFPAGSYRVEAKGAYSSTQVKCKISIRLIYFGGAVPILSDRETGC